MSQRHDQGVSLMHEVIERLRLLGYTKQRVDQHIDPSGKRIVRQHYAGGEWTMTALTSRRNRGLFKTAQVVWDIRRAHWPTAEQVVRSLADKLPADPGRCQGGFVAQTHVCTSRCVVCTGATA